MPFFVNFANHFSEQYARQKSTWYHIQLEIYNSNEARSSIPNSVQLIFESTKGKDHSRSLSNSDP